MKYPIGTKLEYNAQDYTHDNSTPARWVPCIVVGETSYGSPIIELETREVNWQRVFVVSIPEALRHRKIRTEWWSRYWVDEDGTPYAANFKRDRTYIDMKELPAGCSWHGETFFIIVETDSEDLS